MKIVLNRRAIVRLGFIAALVMPFAAVAQFQPHEPLNPAKAQSLPLTPLEIVSGGKNHHFQVEVARSEQEHQTGLMHRTELGADRGMLFIFDPPRDVDFWMRNTFIPLDMIFTDAAGMIIYIAENVQPHDERGVGPHRVSATVLEVNAGTAARLGLKPGDRLKHAAFETRD